MKKLTRFVYFFVLAFAAEAAGQMFTAGGMMEWYPTLHKSALTPPGYVFAIVWNILYLLMAVSAWKVWKAIGVMKSRPIAWWYIQLLLGLIWNEVFFGHHFIEGGLAVLIFVWGATAIAIWLMGRVNKIAGLLMVPQLCWLTFAIYLNYYIAAHN